MVTQIVVKQFKKYGGYGFWYLVECNSCLKHFEIQGFKFNEGKGSFCSKRCYGDYKMVGRIKVRCVQCRSIFENKRTRSRKYCSQKCMGEAYRNEGNPCWRGGIARLPYKHDFKDKLKKEIRERDNYTCHICKKTNLKSFDAHVHHLDGNKMNSDKNNLVVVCRWCHGSISARGIYQI